MEDISSISSIRRQTGIRWVFYALAILMGVFFILFVVGCVAEFNGIKIINVLRDNEGLAIVFFIILIVSFINLGIFYLIGYNSTKLQKNYISLLIQDEEAVIRTYKETVEQRNKTIDTLHKEKEKLEHLASDEYSFLAWKKRNINMLDSMFGEIDMKMTKLNRSQTAIVSKTINELKEGLKGAIQYYEEFSQENINEFLIKCDEQIQKIMNGEGDSLEEIICSHEIILKKLKERITV